MYIVTTCVHVRVYYKCTTCTCTVCVHAATHMCTGFIHAYIVHVLHVHFCTYCTCACTCSLLFSISRCCPGDDSVGFLKQKKRINCTHIVTVYTAYTCTSCEIVHVHVHVHVHVCVSGACLLLNLHTQAKETGGVRGNILSANTWI